MVGYRCFSNFTSPFQSTYLYIFPNKKYATISSIYIYDITYKKKIHLSKKYDLKTLIKHPSYHHKSLILIEYSVKNMDKRDGKYYIIIRGMDTDSLYRCDQYFENFISFSDYFTEYEDELIDAQFKLLEKKIDVDASKFINRIRGIDQMGHKFLHLHHDLLSIEDYWKIYCIYNDHENWINDEVVLNTVDMTLNEKNIGFKDHLFS